MTVDRRILVSGRYVFHKLVSYGSRDPYLGKSILACASMSTLLLTVNGGAWSPGSTDSLAKLVCAPRGPSQAPGFPEYTRPQSARLPLERCASWSMQVSVSHTALPSSQRDAWVSRRRYSLPVDHPPPRKSSSNVSSLRSASKRWASASMAGHSRASMFHTWASSARLLRSQMS